MLSLVFQLCFSFSMLSLKKQMQANVDTIYNRFVHLDNLPEDGLQCVLCIGLQFGRVDHHMYMSNKNKVTRSLLFDVMFILCSIGDIY